MFSASSVKTTLNLSIDLMLVMFDFKPAKIKRELVDKEKQFLIQSSKNYLLYKSWYENSNSTEV